MHQCIFDQDCMPGAIELIKSGKAYVCDLTHDAGLREYRGNLDRAGPQQPDSATVALTKISNLFARMTLAKGLLTAPM